MATVAPAHSVTDEASGYIRDACRYHRRVNVAVPDGDGWAICRGRLLSFDPDTLRLRITQPKPLRGGRAVIFREGGELGVRFVAHDRRIMFMATLHDTITYFKNSQKHQGIEVQIASNVVCQNQRRHYRVPIPEDQPLAIIVRDAALPERKGEDEEPPPTYLAKILDLSVGGAFVGGLEVDPGWKLEDHLGMELRIPDEEPILLLGEIRRIVRAPDGLPCYGLAFIGAETIRKTFDAQEILSRVVTDLQRLHLQRRVETPDSPNAN